MVVALAVITALAFGIADFCGGTAARRLSVPGVVALTQGVGLVLLLSVVILAPGQPSPRGAGWGAAAGLIGSVGALSLYAGLAAGPMYVVAPLTALISAAVPVLAGALFGDRLTAITWVGIGLIVIASGLVGAAPSTHLKSAWFGRAVALALFSGICFGGFFVLLAQAPCTAGLWPVISARISETVVALAMWALGATATKNVKTRTGILSRVDRETFVLVVVGGTIDATANAIYLLSVQRGQLAVVGAIVALYPAVTVLLARILHGERPGNLQGAGLVLAAGALLVVGASS